MNIRVIHHKRLSLRIILICSLKICFGFFFFSFNTIPHCVNPTINVLRLSLFSSLFRFLVVAGQDKYIKENWNIWWTLFVKGFFFGCESKSKEQHTTQRDSFSLHSFVGWIEWAHKLLIVFRLLKKLRCICDLRSWHYTVWY